MPGLGALGLGDLVGSLFGVDLGLGAADLGLGAAADVGAGAAADAAAAGIGADAAAAGLGVADLAPAVGGAAGELAAGAGAGDAALAADVGLGGAAADLGGPALIDAVSPALSSAADASLGEAVGPAVDTFAPTVADLGSVGGIGGATVPSVAAPAASAASLAPPSEILASDPAISSALEFAPGSDVSAGIDASAASDLGPTTNAVALGNAPEAGISALGDQALTPAATTPSEVSASAAAPAGQLAAEGGPSIDSQVAAAQAGGAAAAAPPSLLSEIGGAAGSLGGIASNPLVQLGVPAAFLGYNLLKGPPGIPPQAQEALNNAEATLPQLQSTSLKNVPQLQNMVNEDLNLANNFQVTPAEAAQLAINKQNAYNQLLQQIASQNPGGQVDPKNSSEWIQGKAQIDQQSLAAQDQMIQNLIQDAFNAQSQINASVSTSASITSQFDNLFMAAAQLQVQQDQSFNQALGAAFQAFGLIAGLNATKKAA